MTEPIALLNQLRALLAVTRDGDSIALLPDEVTVEARDVYVDDVMGGLPIVRFANPADPNAPMCVRLTAEAARVLSIALGASADCSEVTGWGKVEGASALLTSAPTNRPMQVLARLVESADMSRSDAREMLALTRGDYPDVFALLEQHVSRVAVAVRGDG